MSKKICFVQDGLGGGGAEHVVVTLANEFVKNGNTVEIGTYSYDTIAYPLDERVKVTKIDKSLYLRNNPGIFSRISDFFSQYIASPVLSVSAKCLNPVSKHLSAYIKNKQRLLLRKINTLKPIKSFVDSHPDYIIISFMVNCYNILFEAIGENKKNIIIISERDDPAAVTSKNMTARRSVAMKNTDACVFQTRDAMDYMINEIGDRGQIIPNPISITLPEKFAGEREKKIVNYCRLNKKKNLSLLISAFNEFHKKHSDYTLNIYGKGELKEQLLQQIKELNLENSAFILDFDPQIHEKIKSYAMFVSSSDFEGISNSMIEAMALGLPVVCTDCPIGGAAMFINSYENGILTPVGDEKALYDAMCYVVENSEKAQEMGENASKITQLLAPESIAKQWEALMDKLI